MSRPRLLVLGGTGRLAGMLRRWETGTFDITCVARQGRREAEPGWRIFDTRTDQAALAVACAQADVILDLSGPTTNPAQAPTGFGIIPVLARAVAHAAAGKPLFWMSSAAVYGARAAAREGDLPAPCADYGRAKMRGEAMLMGRPGVTVVRLGNVAGADALLGALRRGRPVTLDRFADGTTPMRSYIGPKTFVESLFSLMKRAVEGKDMPPVMNLAAPGPGVEMAALLAAAGRTWQPQPAPEGALPVVTLETSVFSALCPLDASTGTAMGLVAEWRADQALQTARNG